MKCQKSGFLVIIGCSDTGNGKAISLNETLLSTM